VGLCPDRLVVRRAGATRVVDAGPDWRSAVQALPAALGAKPPRRLRVILSHHFVRYALLPWNAALRSEEAWRAYAGHRLAAIYGAPAGAWALRVAATAPRGARIACATEQALIDALQAALRARGVRLDSVQPHLMSAYNRERRRLRGASRWLVVEEAGRLALALIERGAWRALRSRRVDAQWREALPALLARETALLGLDAAPPPLVASALA
jgi:predicted secreted protein